MPAILRSPRIRKKASHPIEKDSEKQSLLMFLSQVSALMSWLTKKSLPSDYQHNSAFVGSITQINNDSVLQSQVNPLRLMIIAEGLIAHNTDKMTAMRQK